MKDFELYQMTAERIKDEVMEENRRLQRKLSEKDQSFELVKMVHFDKTIDLKSLNDIIIGCTGCLHSLMFYHNQIITNMDKESELYNMIIGRKAELTQGDQLLVTDQVIPDYTVVMYPVSTSDMLSDSTWFVKHIIMLYPTRLMNRDVLEFVKSFMIVNEVLINIVLTRAKMIELIETDPMTMALNRTSWTDNLKYILEEKEPFFILFFDIDNFKMINDTCGHQKGDEVLKFVSVWLRDTFRGEDRVFRMGGDEFAITGRVNIEHIEGLVAKFKVLNALFNRSVLKRQELNVTLSIGALVARGEYTEKEVYGLVDDLLYESKSKGKNTISIMNTFDFNKSDNT